MPDEPEQLELPLELPQLSPMMELLLAAVNEASIARVEMQIRDFTKATQH